MVDRPKRLADYDLHSERVMWRGKGPGKFEQELGDLEQALGLTKLRDLLSSLDERTLER